MANTDDLRDDVENIREELNKFTKYVGMSTNAQKDVFKSLTMEDSIRKSMLSTANKESKAKKDALKDQERGRNTFNQAVTSTASFASSLMDISQSMYETQKAFTGVTPVVKLMETTATSMTNALGDAMGSIPIAGGVLKGAMGVMSAGIGLVSAALQNQLRNTQALIDNYGELSAVGVTFGGDLKKMQLSAQENGISVDTMTRFVKKNADALYQFDGSITSGAVKLTRFGKNLASTEPRLLALYGGFEGLNSGIADYVAQQTSYGISGSRLNKDLETSARAYLYQQKELADLTGKSVDEQKKAAEERAKSAAFQIALGKMEGNERNNANAMITRSAALGGKALEQYAMEYVSTGGKPISKLAMQVEATMGPLAKTVQQMYSNIGQTEQQFLVSSGDVVSANREAVKQWALNKEDLMVIQQGYKGSNEMLDLWNDAISASMKSMSAQENAGQKAADTIKSREDADQAAINKYAEVLTSMEQFKVKMDALTMLRFDSTAEFVDQAYQMAATLAQTITKMDEILPLFTMAVNGATGALNAMTAVLDTLVGALNTSPEAAAQRASIDQANWEKMDIGEKIESGMARSIEGLGRFLGMDTLARGGQISRIKTESEYLQNKPQMANGGITQGVSIAGEAGPEAIVPLPNGRSIPVDMDLRPLVEALNDLLDVNKDNRDYLEKLFHASV